jgi:IS30 family transposase
VKETADKKRGGRAFQSLLAPHFDFIRDQRQRRKTWREITELLAAEKNVRVCLHTIYYFYKRRLKRLSKPHWENNSISASVDSNRPQAAPTPARKPILAATPPSREIRRPNPDEIKLNDPTQI